MLGSPNDLTQEILIIGSGAISSADQERRDPAISRVLTVRRRPCAHRNFPDHPPTACPAVAGVLPSWPRPCSPRVATTTGRAPSASTPAVTTTSEDGVHRVHRADRRSIEFLTGSDAELRGRIAAEGRGRPTYLTVDAGNLASPPSRTCSPLDSEVLRGRRPRPACATDGSWFGLSLQARTIVYHPDQVAARRGAHHLRGLADPAWEGRVCLRDSSNVYADRSSPA
ncbi:MAG: hypothetical protein R2713_17920 [Ilumatobacteraceae bacterium]